MIATDPTTVMMRGETGIDMTVMMRGETGIDMTVILDMTETIAGAMIARIGTTDVIAMTTRETEMTTDVTPGEISRGGKVTEKTLQSMRNL